MVFTLGGPSGATWDFRGTVFFLFRRPYHQGDKVCIGGATTSLLPGSWLSRNLAIGLGEFTSDQNLLLTDDFAPVQQSNSTMNVGDSYGSPWCRRKPRITLISR